MADIKDSKNWGFETRQLHIGQEQADPVTDARAVPIYASTSYVFHNSQHAADRFGLRDPGNIYGRLTNPTQDVFEQRIASLEGGTAALAAASGAAALAYTFQALARAGEHIAEAAGPAAFVTYIRAVLLRDTGAALSPFHAFIFLQGLETLSLRVERHVENTRKIVKYLADHPQVEAVHHPSLPGEPTHHLYKKYLPDGGGSIFTFEIKGDAQTAQKFIDNLAIFSLLANVADVKSLVIHPATTTHSQCTEEELLEQDIKPNTIRLSIGIENAEDLIAALETAFEVVKE